MIFLSFYILVLCLWNIRLMQNLHKWHQWNGFFINSFKLSEIRRKTSYSEIPYKDYHFKKFSDFFFFFGYLVAFLPIGQFAHAYQFQIVSCYRLAYVRLVETVLKGTWTTSPFQKTQVVLDFAIYFLLGKTWFL